MDERGKSRGVSTRADESSPPLEQLLAEIESETLRPDEGLAGVTPEPGAPHGETVQYIRFMLDGVPFAVPLKSSLEVGRLPAITPLPNLPSWVSGISNIRGDVVSVVDLKQFFGRGPSAPRAGGNMILLHNSVMTVGVRVDRLMGILSLADAESKVTSNPFTRGDITPYLAGVVSTGESLLYLLDVEKLLTSEKMNGFQRL